MNRLKDFIKSPFVWTIVLAGISLGFSLTAWLNAGSSNTQQIVVADIEAITDAQKLIWVQGMKKGDNEKVINESRAFHLKLQKIFRELSGEKTIVLDRKMIVSAKDIEDITPIVMQKLNLNVSEVNILRQQLERDFFTDFPTMRKARPQ